jgi:hypothetical protein
MSTLESITQRLIQQMDAQTQRDVQRRTEQKMAIVAAREQEQRKIDDALSNIAAKFNAGVVR